MKTNASFARLFLVLFGLAAIPSGAETIRLWEGVVPPLFKVTAPYSEKMRGDGTLIVKNVSDPTLEVFRASGEGARPCVIVCPGGGYTKLAYNKEGTEVARWLNEEGFTAFVLKYRVPNNDDGALADALRALDIVRSRAREFAIDPARVGMIGFSAGANLTARVSTTGPRPDFALIIYPWELRASYGKDEMAVKGRYEINAFTPPTFLVQAADDGCNVTNTLAWAAALKKAQVPCEFHVFPNGGHGYGLRKSGAATDGWEKRAADWLRRTVTRTRTAFSRMRYNNPRATTFLKVGLWAWPLALDYDHDGDLDLVVACSDVPYGGTWFFENPGKGTAFPDFRKGLKIAQGNGNIARATSSRLRTDDVFGPATRYPDFTEFRGKCYERPFPIGKLPQNVHGNPLRGNVWREVDWEGDGSLDLLVGVDDWHALTQALWMKTNQENYRPDGTWKGPDADGFVYLIRNRAKKGAHPDYAQPEKVLCANGRPVRTNGNPMPMYEDWDGDGDFDLLCGEFVDGFTYFENIGTRVAPRFAEGRQVKNAAGEDLRMELAMITPSAVDWDGDGLLDIICGDEDGRVAFIRNTGRTCANGPVFEAPRYFRQEADALHFGCLSTPSCIDWDGDGDWDIIAGDSAGHVAFIENLSGPGVGEPSWAEPKRLTADGVEIRIMAGKNGSIQGPIERKWGYTCLTAADWDGDGLPDIMVNSIWGDVVWYRNIGTRTAPRLAAAEDVVVEWEGEQPGLGFGWHRPADKKNPKALLTQWRTTPVMTDWNKDGLMDLVMLDTEGYLAFYRRAQKDGRLVLLPPVRCFADEKGVPLRLNARQHGHSGRRKIALVDWDGDGRLDLIANAKNAVWYRNLGETDGMTRFAAPVDLAEQRLSNHSTAPAFADFNGDGRPDLVLGAEDGYFYYLKNTSAAR